MVKYLQENEKPDVIIGLFHSGKDGGIQTAEYDEDASIKVAKEVPGFDLILFGHDHTRDNEAVPILMESRWFAWILPTTPLAWLMLK